MQNRTPGNPNCWSIAGSNNQHSSWLGNENVRVIVSWRLVDTVRGYHVRWARPTFAIAGIGRAEHQDSIRTRAGLHQESTVAVFRWCNRPNCDKFRMNGVCLSPPSTVPRQFAAFHISKAWGFMSREHSRRHPIGLFNFLAHFTIHTLGYKYESTYYLYYINRLYSYVIRVLCAVRTVPRPLPLHQRSARPNGTSHKHAAPEYAPLSSMQPSFLHAPPLEGDGDCQRSASPPDGAFADGRPEDGLLRRGQCLVR